MKQLLRDILYELRKQNKKLNLLTKGDWQLESLIQLTVQVNQLSDEIKKLQAIESSKEHSVTYRCVSCQEPACLFLENNKYICDTCAQIQGELAID
ncbi:hypothetical protein ACODH8_09820 [Vagococcus fluvialis]|uniref:hypothetical protein n=1 Tax=Vagococcus fluvialis TaxID=2738 RepID=UPI003B5C7BF1